MKQSYKIYENLLSAVAVYRAGATKHSTFYKESDEASVVSSDSDQDPGTDDSGVDSINSDPQLTVGSGGCEVGSMLSTLSERAETDCDLSWSEDSRGDSAAVRSFLHTSKQSELWSRAPTKTSVNHQMLMSPHHLLTPDHNGSSLTVSDDLSELSDLLNTTSPARQTGWSSSQERPPTS